MNICPYVQYNDAEILSLYESVGWTAYTGEPDVLRRAFGNSLAAFAAYDNERLVGIIRAVGDGCTIVFIQDLLVHPDSQRQGVGSALLKEMLAHFSHVRQIQLTTDNRPETINFYRKLGFVPHEEIQCCGMYAVRRNP